MGGIIIWWIMVIVSVVFTVAVFSDLLCEKPDGYDVIDRTEHTDANGDTVVVEVRQYWVVDMPGGFIDKGKPKRVVIQK